MTMMAVFCGDKVSGGGSVVVHSTRQMPMLRRTHRAFNPLLLSGLRSALVPL